MTLHSTASPEPSGATSSDPLFEPITIGGLTLPNRIVMAPMGVGRAVDGVPTEEYRDFLARRAANDVGLIVTGATFVDHPSANNHPLLPQLRAGTSLDHWREIVDAVHATGGRIMVQLMHAGAERVADTSAEPHVPAYSPSGTDGLGDTRSLPMRQQDITDAVDAFRRSAVAAAEAGFDGIEIHGAHGYLIDLFLWAQSNQRDDIYGKDRTRFAGEVVRAVRAELGDSFPIGFRLSQWKMRDFTARIAHNRDELRDLVERLAALGLDLISVSTRRYWQPAFEGSARTMASLVKEYSHLPTATVGSVGLAGPDFETVFAGQGAEVAPLNDVRDRMRQGQFDLVAVGRALLGDPEWALKARQGHQSQMQAFRASSLFEDFR